MSHLLKRIHSRLFADRLGLFSFCWIHFSATLCSLFTAQCSLATLGIGQQSITPSMGVSFSNLTDAACAVHQFKINGYSATKSMARTDTLPSKRLAVGGYEWEVHYTPSLVVDGGYWIAFRLVLLSAPRRNDVKAAFRCRLLYTSSNSYYGHERGACVRDSIGNVEGQMSHAFKRAKESSGWIALRKRNDVEAARVIENDSFTAECTITVVTELPEPDTAKTNVVRPPIPPLSDLHSLHHDLGELLSKATGFDVVLVVSGETFAAHKAILASRSPVFMAQFFGPMKETHSQRVEIMDMEAPIFGAMLRFMYTDMVPELERQEDGTIIAQHLLAAADRYGLDMLKSMCEDKLCDGTRVETAATTLALAEQHGCPKLKARCVEFIAANLDDVMATESYKHLMTSSPLVLNDLLRAVRGRKN
ncbi:BTB/POZ and MATH domain-containing protein 1-like isoform X2 [Miscanthus floridulus]|uniref:BTB/POZ and MATH domain-containing protein 1-like isoform X2 n=1 Tax=Miscanthus floridulus TaxID=154761 RepID=UPI00345A3B49